ncbi:MAG: hypothetical protein QOD39_5262 [Mycobacterium sp.]|jgi:hypothetical protein|nr:hypothetical protein [Mycobacterium sp.]
MAHSFISSVLVSLTIATTVVTAGCASESTSPEKASRSAAPASGASPEADAALKQFEDAATPFHCSPVYDDMADAAYNNKLPAMRDNAVKYRQMLSTWDGKLAKMSFPSAAQSILDRIRHLSAGEMNGLDVLAAVVEEDYTTLSNDVYALDWTVQVEIDRLSAALGHPKSQARLAQHQLEVAYQTFNTDDYWTASLFDAALAHNDLGAAKAANAIQENALQRYIDRLDAIEWPDGFDDQVNGLRDNLRKMIEFDRRQVDVATTAQVVTPENLPEVQAAEDAETALFVSLGKMADESDPPPKC